MRIGWRISLQRAALLLIAALVPAGAQVQDWLKSTSSLTEQGDLAIKMVESIDQYLMHRLAASPASRKAPQPADRDALRRSIGVVDARVRFDAPALLATTAQPAKVGQSVSYDVFAVKWPALPGMHAEGLLLQPRQKPVAVVIALGDADWTPEMVVSKFAHRLAASGCLVLIPHLINRSDEFSGKPGVRFTNQPHREFVYRMAYEMGRHIIGYEAQKVQAALDWFERSQPGLRVGLIGYGEGGLLALYSAAIDDRIDSTVVSGYFGPREEVWKEPIYRNVWSQLLAFGDAELAALVAPRALIVEASPHPDVAGPPAPRDGRRGAASGGISTPPLAKVKAEYDRALAYRGKAVTVLTTGAIGSAQTLLALAKTLGITLSGAEEAAPKLASSDPRPVQQRQIKEMVDYTQELVRQSGFVRKKAIAPLDLSSPAAWDTSAEPFRKQLWEEVIGRMPPSERGSKASARQIYDKPAFTGFEVVLPVWGDIYAYGLLLVPKNIQPGERRPVVVAQHGLEGKPQFLVEPPDERNDQVYARFAARLAERGFIVFAPQNPYIGQETFRILVRKSHPLKLTLFSFIIGQHARILDWLGTLPFVDAGRIGFYGLSYGGKTAMRVPSVLPGYALSICSGDFNEWVWKVTSVDEPLSYMYTGEYDMLEFNLGHTFNYFEMASLIAPRPFMVERGHSDGVGIDEWVALEYAKVRRLYDTLGIGNRTTIEYFNGPHQIHGVGTYDFLHRHLGWPAPDPR